MQILRAKQSNVAFFECSDDYIARDAAIID